jgi:hypothetical protein
LLSLDITFGNKFISIILDSGAGRTVMGVTLYNRLVEAG